MSVALGTGLCLSWLSASAVPVAPDLRANFSLEPTRVGKPPLAAQLQR